MLETLEAVGSVLVLLLGFGLVLALAYGCTRFLGKHYGGGPGLGSGGYIKIIDKAALGQDRMLCIVQVAGKTLLLGVTAHSVQRLCRLEEKDLVSLSADPAPSPFSDILKGMLGKRPESGKGEDHG